MACVTYLWLNVHARESNEMGLEMLFAWTFVLTILKVGASKNVDILRSCSVKNQGLSNAKNQFQVLSRPWNRIPEIQGFSRVFNTRTNLEANIVPHQMLKVESVPSQALEKLRWKIGNKFQGLSSTDCNFQGLLRPWIFILKFKDF